MKFAVSWSIIASFELIAWANISTHLVSAYAFLPSTRASTTRGSSLYKRAIIHHPHQHQYHRAPAAALIRLQSSSPDEPRDGDDTIINNQEDSMQKVPNDLGLDIIRVRDTSEIPDETWDDIEGGAPNQLMVMKDLLGINIFTYILAALIVFFLSMNAIFGPGWLGQSLGWEDVGTFTKVSDSLPLNVDVSAPEYLL